MAVSLQGVLPDYRVKSLRRDKTGVYRGVIIRHFLVGTVGQRVDPAWLSESAAPNIWSIPLDNADAQVLNNGVCEVTYNYEGVDPNSPPNDERETQFELDTTFAGEDIETHPKFKELAREYGWDPIERRFSEQLPETSGQNGFAKNGGKNKENPLFGTDQWLVVGAIFRRTRALLSVPDEALRGIGTIVERPPSIGSFQLPSDSKNRNWLKMAPQITKRGNAIELSEEWMLSGPKGWAKPIYDRGQLGDD
jgi:hypothetical protein